MKKEYYYGILPLALTSCLVSQTSAQERQINRPNVVFIYADDIGYGDLSCNGAKSQSLLFISLMAMKILRLKTENIQLCSGKYHRVMVYR